MANRRKAHLDALEKRLTGPKRVGLFGHRAVGKTTLLAIFYREASNGRVPGVRLAAGDPVTAEYLADKIARIEAGEPLPGTLAETPLRLRLYHGLSRLDLRVKDYQGEHLTLGSDAPIRDFFTDCDAVLLCLDPEATADPVARRTRQQEVEDLLERYIEQSNDGTAGRPVALLVTKYDRVLDHGGPGPEFVDRLVEAHYGMTRHSLARHVPRSGIFAVSSYGLAAGPDGRPPVDLEPMGLEAPLAWLAEQLEEIDREGLQWLWDLAPDDLPRLERCVKAFEHRYPRSDHSALFRRRLNDLRRRRRLGRLAKVAVGTALFLGAVVGYDAWGYHDALTFERGRHPATAVESKWSQLIARHPTLPLFFPDDARQARRKLTEWRVKAAELRVELGTAEPELAASMREVKERAPDLLLQINRVEQAEARAKQERAWQELRVADLVAIEDPEAHLDRVRQYLRDYPDTMRKPEAVALAQKLEAVIAERRSERDRQVIDALNRAASLPDAPLRDLIEQAERFLTEHPESRYALEAEDLLNDFVRRLDETEIARARRFSKENPTNFTVRREKYLDYLKTHAEGGRFVSEANAALEAIDRERDVYLYRQAYDHFIAHPDDAPTIAGRLRTYLDANPSGRFVESARAYTRWWEKISVPGEYRVVLRRGQVESDVAKTFSGGGPDLSVKVWVAGVEYGPSPVIKDTFNPIWDWTFPVPIRWKYGDPITIRIFDHDWSTSTLFTLNTPAGDKLALRILSGTVRPSKGGKTELVFASDFQEPKLPKPD